MKISRIKLSGFRGVKNTLELTFPSGFVVVCGANGTGKSTICDAVEFVLTGGIRGSSNHKEKGESIYDYLWWIGEAPSIDQYVEVEFSDGSESKLVIRRTKAGELSVPEDTIREALCKLTEAPPDCLTELARTAMLRDEGITQLSIDLPESERFKFARDAVGSAAFADFEEKANELLQLAKTRRTPVELEYNRLRDQINELAARLSQAKAESSGYEEATAAETNVREILGSSVADPSRLLEAARSLTTDLRLRVNDLSQLRRDLDEAAAKNAQLKEQGVTETISKLMQHRQELEARLYILKMQQAELLARIKPLEDEKPLLTSLAELTNRGRFLGLADGKCPLCGSEIDKSNFDDHLKEIGKRIDAEESTLSKLVQERSAITNSVREIGERMQGVVEEIMKQERRKTEVNRATDMVAMMAERLGFRISDETPLSTDLIQQEIERTQKVISGLDRNLTILQASDAYGKLLGLQRELEETREKSSALDGQLRKIQQIENDAKASFDTVRRISGEIVEERLSEIRPLLSELFVRLKPHMDWQQINYSLRGEVRRLLSLSVGEGLNPSFMFSSGQRRAVGLAFLLSIHLARSWCKLKTLFLDDPVQHIDDYRALHLTEVLSAIRKSGRQVICTVEDPALANLLCRRLRSAYDDEGILVHMQYQPGEGVRIESKEEIIPLRKRILLAG